MTCGERGDLLAQEEKQGIGTHEKRSRAFLLHGSERCINLALAARVNEIDFYARGLRRCLHFLDLRSSVHIVRIQQVSDLCDAGQEVAQDLEPLRLQQTPGIRNAGHVAAGPVEGLDEPRLHGVSPATEDDWNGRGRGLRYRRRT